MRGFLWSTPLFLPGVVLSILIAIVLGPGVARWLGTRLWVAILGLVSAGCIIVATLTPDRAVLLGGSPSSGRCELARFGMIPLSELMRISEPSLNVLLFVPLGIAIGLLPWSRRTLVVVVATILAPFAVEILQAAFPALGRGCESADVVDNLTGLALGVLVGGLARSCAGWIARRGDRGLRS